MKTQREKWVRTIKRERVSAIIRTNDQALAAEAMQAAVDGGFKLIEFAKRDPELANLRGEARFNHLITNAGDTF